MRILLLIIIQLTLALWTGCAPPQNTRTAGTIELEASDISAKSLILTDAPETSIAPYLYGYTGELAEKNPQEIVKVLAGRNAHRFKNSLDMSFIEGRQWLTFRVKNPYSHEMRFVLENNVPLFSAWLISVSENGAVSIGRAGVSEPSADPKNALLPAIAVTFPPGNTVCYLGVDTSRNLLAMQLRLWTSDAYRQHSRAHLLWLTLMFGMAAALLLSQIVLGSAVRFTAYIHYVILTTCFWLLLSVITGYFSILPSGWSIIFAKLWPLFNSLTLIFTVQFIIRLLGFKQDTHPIAMRLTLVLCLLELPLAASIFLPGAQLSFIIMTATTCTLFGTVSFMAVHAVMCGNRLVLYLVPGLLPVISVSLLDAVTLSGAFPDSTTHPLLQMAAGLVFVFCLLLMLGAKISADRQNHERIKISLKGVIADAQIEKLNCESFKIMRQPVEQEVTVMFVDIVGSSLIFRRIDGYQAFHSIKQVLHELSDIVHRHGGVIDKSLGDGILCFFGYDLSGTIREDHAQVALQCALALQQHTLAKTLEASEDSSESQVFPLRIGINTARVHIGNMGDEQRLDITISGEGVVLANRFESACEPYKIILGNATRERLDPAKINEAMLTRILVPIKHMKTLMEAYECNPFPNREQQLQETRVIFWRLHQIKRINERQSVAAPLAIGTPFGEMTLVNFSQGGFCLDAAVFLGKGVVFELKLDLPLNEAELKVISPLTVEVTWSSINTNGSYRHGVKILGGNAAQHSLIYDQLHTHLAESLQGRAKFVA